MPGRKSRRPARVSSRAAGRRGVHFRRHTGRLPRGWRTVCQTASLPLPMRRFSASRSATFCQNVGRATLRRRYICRDTRVQAKKRRPLCQFLLKGTRMTWFCFPSRQCPRMCAAFPPARVSRSVRRTSSARAVHLRSRPRHGARSQRRHRYRRARSRLPTPAPASPRVHRHRWQRQLRLPQHRRGHLPARHRGAGFPERRLCLPSSSPRVKPAVWTLSSSPSAIRRPSSFWTIPPRP